VKSSAILCILHKCQCQFTQHFLMYFHHSYQFQTFATFHQIVVLIQDLTTLHLHFLFISLTIVSIKPPIRQQRSFSIIMKSLRFDVLFTMLNLLLYATAPSIHSCVVYINDIFIVAGFLCCDYHETSHINMEPQLLSLGKDTWQYKSTVIKMQSQVMKPRHFYCHVLLFNS
jgi:hypothetical protein